MEESESERARVRKVTGRGGWQIPLFLAGGETAKNCLGCCHVLG